MEFQAVLDAVRSWPMEDQVRLVDLLQDDLLAETNDLDVTPEQMKEVQRRIAAYDANPRIAIPWEEVEASIEQELKKFRE